VAPPTVVPRRRYAATAIALALWLLGVQRESHDAVRDAVGVHTAVREAAEGQRWSALVKWARAARAGDLLHGIHCTGTLREAAGRAAMAIMGHGIGEAGAARTWSGALATPWRGPS
jgi:hypothetical protein